MLMPELPVVKPRKVIRALEKAGFIKIRTRGSHVQMKKGNCLEKYLKINGIYDYGK